MVLISRWVVYTSPCWNFNFFIWHETETWTGDRSWKQEMIDEIITLVMYLKCNLRTRHGFEKKSHDQVDDFTNQRYQSRGIPSISFNLYPVKKLKNGKDWFFCMWNLVSKLWLVLRTRSLLTNCFYCPQLQIRFTLCRVVWNKEVVLPCPYIFSYQSFFV